MKEEQSNGNGTKPMDVSAVFYGKGKNGKDKKGKTKKDKNGKGKPTTEKFDGECGYCGKRAHKRADYRKKTYDEKGMGKGAIAASGGTDGPSVSAVKCEDLNMEQKPDSWAFAAQVEFVACSA